MSEEQTTAAVDTTAQDNVLENNAYTSEELYTAPPEDTNIQQTEVQEPDATPDTQNVSEDGVNTEPTEAPATDTQNTVVDQQELDRKLREYEIQQQEQQLLRQRLGIDDSISDEQVSLINMEQRVVNQGKTAYLDLCNKYGIDSDPARLDANVAELKKIDPAKGYEFERAVERLTDEINGKKAQIAQYQYNNSVNQFAKDYGEILNASPALNNALTQVAQANYNNPYIYETLKGSMDYLTAIYAEAYQYGQKNRTIEDARKDTSGVQGSITKDINQTTPNTRTFTAEDIANMSQDEFEKNYNTIMKMYAEGKIQ